MAQPDARTDELPVTIRLMTPADSDEIAYVAKRLPEYFHEGGVKYIGRAVGDRQGLVAVYGGQIVGFAIYDLTPPVAEILWMGVLPFYQGRGVGRRLVETLIERLGPPGHGVTAIEARTLAPHVRHDGYVNTRAFYENIGFQLAGIEHGHFADGTDAAVYRRPV
jgi:ribosomal protein S18 acetylase RimI-like enzyme